MEPNKLHIIVDNTADMPQEWLETYQIDMLSMPIMLGEKTFYEHQTITKQSFYDWVSESFKQYSQNRLQQPLRMEKTRSNQSPHPGDSVLIMPLAQRTFWQLQFRHPSLKTITRLRCARLRSSHRFLCLWLFCSRSTPHATTKESH